MFDYAFHVFHPSDLKMSKDVTKALHICMLSIALQADGMLKLDLQAHSRLLCAMAVHPTRPVFATAAEDATLAVWTLPDGDQDVSLVQSALNSCSSAATVACDLQHPEDLFCNIMWSFYCTTAMLPRVM